MNKVSIPHPPKLRKDTARQGDLIWITREESIYILARVTSDAETKDGLSIIGLEDGNVWTWYPLYTRENHVSAKVLSDYIGASCDWGFADKALLVSVEER